MRKALLGLTLCAMLILAITLAGCGGSYSGSTGPIGSNSSSAPVSLTIGDDPPAGVAILRYQTQVTDAELQPMDPTQPPVSMLLGPLNVELLHLQTETAPLGNINVPSGIYSGLTATFANPEMTVFNNSAQTLTLGSQTCAPNQICIFNPTLNQTTASVTSPTAPFPVTLSANSPLGFEMHFDVNASVQGNLTVSPQITLKQVIPPSPTSPIDQFHVIGRISAINSPTFTIQTGFGNLSAVITTNSSTTYDFARATRSRRRRGSDLQSTDLVSGIWLIASTRFPMRIFRGSVLSTKRNTPSLPNFARARRGMNRCATRRGSSWAEILSWNRGHFADSPPLSRTCMASTQLPGLAVQRLMNDGYGFGAEGDWKTAALLRAMKVMAAGLAGGTSFMEDYTYHLNPDGHLVLGARHAGGLRIDSREASRRWKSIRWGSAEKPIPCGWCSMRRPARRSTHR